MCNIKHIIIQPAKDENFCFFTIGYERKSFENYFNQLIKNNIKLLYDIRKNPISRKYGFSKRQLEKVVNNIDIEYMAYA
ncbi:MULTISPECIES: DUF488 family protein [unclassified Bartonella]|uniref:DUF488 family protein n=1 Tax=unclassified Bartonella TaxID=2645622 RepID=UPI0035CEE0C7